MIKWLALMTLLVPALGWAQDEPGLRDLMHARDYAMGGAYRATGLGAESASGNPASMAMFKRYQIELSGAWDYQTKYAFGTVAVVDSVTSPVTAGLAYHFVSMGRGENRRVAHFNTVSTAMPITPNFHIGVSGRHLLMTGAREANAITMDVGVLFKATDSIAASVSGHNLIDTNNPELTRYYALSLAYLGGLFTLSADLRADLGIAPTPQFAYSFGGEYILAGQFPVRAGYSLDTILGTQHLSFGLGFLTEGGGFDIAYRHELGGLEGKLFAATFKMQLQM